MAKRFELAQKKFIILIGSPGLYEGKDSAHDNAWFNYADPIMQEAKAGSLAKPSEDVVWLLFAPGYKKRWADDSKEPSPSDKNPLSRQRYEKHVQKIKEAGASDYIDYIKKKAAEYVKDKKLSITVVEISSGAEFWAYLGKQPDKSISRVWYSGHGAYDLWLTLYHSDKTPVGPSDPGEIIERTQIEKNKSLAKKFSSSSQASKFIGCNTNLFAEDWSKTFHVNTEGAEGTIHFDRHNLSDLENSADLGWKKFNKP